MGKSFAYDEWRLKPPIKPMLDLVPSYYLVFLALGLAAIVVVLVYSFTRTTNYEVQERMKRAQQRRERLNKENH